MTTSGMAGTVKTKTRTAPPKAVIDLANSQAERLRQRAELAKDQTAKLRSVQDKMQDALARGDLEQVKALNADFQSVKAACDSTTKDLSQALMALGEEYKDIGIEIAALKEMNVDEKKIIENAEAMVKRTKDVLAEAEKMWNIFGRRDVAVKSAKDDIVTAEQGVETAKELAATKQRERLMNAKLDESLDRLQQITVQAIQIASERVSDIEEDLSIVDSGLSESMVQQQDLTREVEGLDSSLNELESRLGTLNDQMQETQENTEARSNLETLIVQVSGERDRTQAERTKKYMVLQELQRFIEQYKLHRGLQLQTLELQKAWIATLELAVEKRTDIYDSHIGAMKAMADQQAMEGVDKVGVATDEKLAGDALNMMKAGQKAVVERLERAPEDIRRQREIIEAAAQAQADFETRINGVLEMFRKNYGTNPLYDSVKDHRGEGAQAA